MVETLNQTYLAQGGVEFLYGQSNIQINVY